MRVTSKQYLEANPDVAKAGIDPLYHALTYAIDGKEPRCLTIPDDFDGAAYLAHWKDVAAAGVDPVIHYLGWGWKEGRWPINPPRGTFKPPTVLGEVCRLPGTFFMSGLRVPQ